MKPDSEIWFEEAVWDLENAEILLENERYNTAVFHAQQAAEKAVKSLLFHRNLNGWGHSIGNLLNKYNEITDRDIEEVLKYAYQLDKHYLPTRYPDALPNIAPHKAYAKEEALLSVEHAKKIIDFIKDEIEHFKEIKKEKNEKKKEEDMENNGKDQ